MVINELGQKGHSEDETTSEDGSVYIYLTIQPGPISSGLITWKPELATVSNGHRSLASTFLCTVATFTNNNKCPV